MPYPVIPDTPVNQAAPIDGQKATYAAAIIGLVPASSCTDLFTLTGSATKTVRVTRVEVSGTQTTGGAVDIALLKRSTADSAGTSTSPTIVPYDANSPAATASVKAYTANPTAGNLVGKIRADSVSVPAATGAPGLLAYNFGDRPSQAVVLRGTSQVLAVNLNGVTVTGGAFDITVEWSEE